MNHLFEVPYNFDEALLRYYRKHNNRISFLYLPPFKEDLINTRTCIQTSTKGVCYAPQTRFEYEHHLHLIKEAGLRFIVLWQDPTNTISKAHLDYYTTLGCAGFTIGNDFNAKIIKDYNSSLLVICSLVQRVRADILKRDFSNYDYIILYYCYNRALDAIKTLNQLKEKIILMPNSLCHIECPSMHHWFPSKSHPFDPHKDCWLSKKSLQKCGIIFPEHLRLFNPHVGGYKLQGREFSTETIKYLCHFYFTEEFYLEFISPFLRTDMAKILYEQAHSNTSPESYYNFFTQSLMRDIHERIN